MTRADSVMKQLRVATISCLAVRYYSVLADSHFTKRYNVCIYLHWSIFKEYNIETQPVLLHEPALTTSQESVVIFYDKLLECGRYIGGGAIKPDIIVAQD